ncbi:nitroreductase family deazaflavin-dependent oxidoreductase [Mycobacterium sp. SMC-4]|uniref:nitroreductase family deazaflavin-dependent oxidoreductase n=1 Tax=Mycobacterium sp. SMC-4 TaxID=2857059 RepID=UPI0021B29EDB|nr:nitroreductase family deazaflavin-dependent oxidoreductase [Mycobacterium sp. SMC-4]UXA18455.1 nitroreductase family deazaflavin-dependent oxidoreductase [Mycobacterium sp. SMC-4]
MSFVSSNGTRGAKQPGSGLLPRLVNRIVSARIRKGAKLLGNSDGLILTTIGRKTGVLRSTPVNYFPGPQDSWLIVASAAGAPKNPSWYYNIAASPDMVQVELAGRTIAVHAEQLRGAERAAAWQMISQANSRFAKYAEKTDREFPIIRLTERSVTS